MSEQLPPENPEQEPRPTKETESAVDWYDRTIGWLDIDIANCDFTIIPTLKDPRDFFHQPPKERPSDDV